MSTPEVHLFIIWEKARHEEKTILNDIKNNFKILKQYEISWTKKYFSDNLTRFYGTNLPPGSGKQEHVGIGPFLLIIVEDKKPKYRKHNTSKGQATVNSNTFLAKTRHRELTGGGHRIHATNNPTETDHDLTLLLGVNTEDLLEKIKNQNDHPGEKPEQYKGDLVGAKQWESLSQLFYVLNSTIDYIVMRNFEPLPNEFYAEKHGDIDLLATDYQQIKYITNGEELFPQPYRVHNRVHINNEWILFDFRFVGDNYYDSKWEKILLARKSRQKGFNTPDKEGYFYSLLYHALIHKPKVAPDYISRLEDLRPFPAKKINEAFFQSGEAHKYLGKYLAKNSYVMTVPADQSVFVNEDNFRKVKKAIWYSRPAKYGLRKIAGYVRK